MINFQNFQVCRKVEAPQRQQAFLWALQDPSMQPSQLRKVFLEVSHLLPAQVFQPQGARLLVFQFGSRKVFRRMSVQACLLTQVSTQYFCLQIKWVLRRH